MSKPITIFEGIVNGQKFTDREAMETFIGKLVTNGQPITQLEFNTQLGSPEALNCPICSDGKPQAVKGLFRMELERNKPEFAHGDIMQYMIPFVKEEVFVEDSQTHKIGMEKMLEDCEAKLHRRMDVFVKLVTSRIGQPRFVQEEIRAFILELRDRYQAKAAWCKSRVEFYTGLLAVDGENPGLINTYACEMALKVYTLTNGFCAAMVDICTENLNTLSC